MLRTLVACLLLSSSILLGQVAPAPATVEDAQYSLQLPGFFPDGKGGTSRRLNVYLLRRNGQWAGSLGTTANDSGRATWNTSQMLVDASKLVVAGGRVSGTITVTLVPDPWVPNDQVARTATVDIDGNLDGNKIAGRWTSTIPGDAAQLAKVGLSSQSAGNMTGGLLALPVHSVELASYDLTLYGLIPGKTPDNFQRRRGLSLGIKDGRVVSARLAQMDMRHSMYDHVQIETPEAMTVTADAISGPVSFTTDSLEGEPVEFKLEFAGKRLATLIAGSWKGTQTTADGKVTEVSGFFKGVIGKNPFIPLATKPDSRPWFVEPKAFVAVKPGEHPRLFFRKGDLPELRRRAKTPEGQRIIARLGVLLDGKDGTQMPQFYNPATKAYAGGFKYKDGSYSISHAAGYGFLYQLTGDKLYADLARKCVEKGFEGQRNHDDRYAWVGPGGELRAGPSIGWTAVAYDLCYDGWDEAFRKTVALKIQNYSDVKGGEWNNPEGIELGKMIMTPKQGPGSNHFGAVVGGSGLAVLAIKGDPGTDDALLTKYMTMLDKQVVRHVSAGWGDGGYYKEGWGASTVGTQGGFLCFLQAMKTAWGHDYLNVERTNASYITMVPRSLMLLGPPAVLPYRSNMGGTYGSADFHRERTGFSHGGHFSEGFGAIADRYKPALLWTYNHVVETNREKDTFDTLSGYPHRCMMALVNWPTFSGITEVNPAELMPLATRDSLYNYFVFRNGYKDSKDIVTTALLSPPDGTRPRGIMVWGYGGLKLELADPRGPLQGNHYEASRDGSGTLTGNGIALAVDYSKASGADAVIITLGVQVKRDPGTPKAKLTDIEVGSVKGQVLTLSEGEHPMVSVAGDTITVGKQRFSWADGKLAVRP